MWGLSNIRLIFSRQKVGHGLALYGMARFQALKFTFLGLKILANSLVLLVRSRYPLKFEALKFKKSGPEICQIHPAIPYPTFCLPKFRQAPKSTRKRNTLPKTQVIDRSQKKLRFRVCCDFGRVLVPFWEGSKEHAKMQHIRQRRFSERPIFCVFGCVAFSGALCSPLILWKWPK